MMCKDVRSNVNEFGVKMVSREKIYAQPYALTEVAVTGVIIVKQMYYSDTRQLPLMVRVQNLNRQPPERLLKG